MSNQSPAQERKSLRERCAARRTQLEAGATFVGLFESCDFDLPKVKRFAESVQQKLKELHEDYPEGRWCWLKTWKHVPPAVFCERVVAFGRIAPRPPDRPGLTMLRDKRGCDWWVRDPSKLQFSRWRGLVYVLWRKLPLRFRRWCWRIDWFLREGRRR